MIAPSLKAHLPKDLAIATVTASLTAIAYATCAHLERWWDLSRGTVWWPAGIAVACVYLFGFKALLGVFVGEWIVASYQFGCPVAMGMCTGLGNMLEALLCVFVLRQGKFTFQFRPDDMRTLFIAASLAPLPMLMLQMPACYVFNWWPEQSRSYLAAVFYVNDLVAIVYTVPFVLAVRQIEYWLHQMRPRLAELLCLLAGLSLTASITFGLSTGAMFACFVTAMFPFIAWSAIRFRPVVMPLVLMHFAMVLAACVLFELDPFPKDSLTTFPHVHVLLLLHWLTACLISVAISTRDKSLRMVEKLTWARWARCYAAGIASIIRNQMTVVIGSAQLVDLGTTPRTPLLNAMKQSADRLCTLSDQLLACSGRGTFPAEKVAVDVKQILRSVADEIAYPVAITDDLPNGGITGDARLVHLAIRNVLLNAMEAGGSGEITIRCFEATYCKATENESPIPDEQACFVVVRIKDQGVGMSNDVRSRMFDPFFSTKSPDRGLGLAAVQGVMKSISGFILVETAPGQGTAVELCFPRD